jgi:putative sugar O-methyltransferase
MRVRLRHFLHPQRTIGRAGELVRERLERRRFAKRGRRQFIGDARYDLKAVSEGFADRIETEVEDTAILERICSAYQRAHSEEKLAPEAYRPTGWWEMQRHGSLQPVMHALANGDVETLGLMYRNFYRDACSAGLILVQSLAKEYFGGRMTDQHRRYVLADALYRVDHWKKMTAGAYAVRELAGPLVGNPFGVVIDGTLVRAGAEYQHFCATRVAGMLTREDGTVAEIGGGYGGMAYYLLRERRALRYVGFDVAESVALTSYYLMRSFPERRFLLYGETQLNEESLANADVVLLPVFALPRMALRAEITFSSHAMSDLSEAAQEEYSARVSAIASGRLLCVGEATGMNRLDATLSRGGVWTRVRERELDWNVHRNPRAREVERAYRSRE